MNHLYFGDSLDILRQLHAQHPQGFIDLVYSDPPFNSKRNYNVLFETVDLHDAKAQKEAFADTWSNVSYKDTIEELKTVDLNLHKFLDALDHVGISQGAVSYLTTMAIRIYYIHKVLKPTGSFYLHCDPTMSHYLKLICDLVFGEKNFRNEIIWHYGQRTDTHKSHFSRKHDVILLFSKSPNAAFNPISEPWSKEEFLAHRHDVKKDENGKEFIWTDGGKKGVRYKRYVEEVLAEGKPFDDVWDMPLLNSAAKERLGYPTQKPEALLERIIQASSNEGDLVADFFSGCGTTIAAAQKLNRKWIGVDISHLAIGLIRSRLLRTYDTNKTKPENSILRTFDIDGLPKDVGSAKALALVPQGRMHFQDWVIETLLGGVANEKKTGDGGYDGYTTLEVEKGKKEIVLIEVKSGNITVGTLRSFAKTVQQQKGSAGILVCFAEQITKGMRSESKGEGYFREDVYGNRFDKIQIISVEDLLEGKLPELPRSYETGPFKKAERAEVKKKKTKELFD